MLKFVSILFSVFSLTFIVSYSTVSQPDQVAIEFSKDAVAVESGQPVYSKGTKVWLSNPQKEDIKLFLNEEVKEINGVLVDLSEITNLEEGTYTLVVNTNSEQKVFGFTIQ
ncbi:hypothetical protein [Ekhidna sp.]